MSTARYLAPIAAAWMVGMLASLALAAIFGFSIHGSGLEVYQAPDGTLTPVQDPQRSIETAAGRTAIIAVGITASTIAGVMSGLAALAKRTPPLEGMSTRGPALFAIMSWLIVVAISGIWVMVVMYRATIEMPYFDLGIPVAIPGMVSSTLLATVAAFWDRSNRIPVATAQQV